MQIIKNLPIIITFFLLGVFSSLFAQIHEEMYEKIGQTHNVLCQKWLQNPPNFLLESTTNTSQLTAEQFYFFFESPIAKWLLLQIDSLIESSKVYTEKEFFLKWKVLKMQILQNPTLWHYEKKALLRTLFILKYSYHLWKSKFPKPQMAEILRADAFGAIKGILAGLLFFALYDFSRQPTPIGIIGGIVIAVAVPAVSSTIAAIRYKKEEKENKTNWYYD